MEKRVSMGKMPYNLILEKWVKENTKMTVLSLVNDIY